MQTAVTFKNLDPSEALRNYVTDKLNRFDRFLDNPAEASVVLSVEKFRHIAEINITGDRLNINGAEETDDMYSAIDITLDKLETQIKKTKQKLRSKRNIAKQSIKDRFEESSYLAEDDGAKEIKIQNIEYKPMDIEEAVMQIDLSDDNFLVFTNARTGRVNVIYHRKDGHYGLIQPSS